METKIVRTQKEFDAIPLDFDGRVEITGNGEWLRINARPKAYMVVSGSATIEYVYGSATIEYVYGSATIKYVSGSATVESVSDSATIKYVYGSATIKYVSGSATIESVYDSATIKYVYGSATIKYVSGSATIESVSDSATIKYVSGSATVESVSGSATIEYVSGSATIEYVYGSATIKYVSGSATIESVSGSATISKVFGYAAILFISGMATVNTFGMNTVRYFENQDKIKLTVSDQTTVIKLPAMQPTWESYASVYGYDPKAKKVLMYKTVHKTGKTKLTTKYFSDYDKSFTYKIGKTYQQECAPHTNGSCSVGIHVAYKQWAILFGKSWEDVALLECEVETKDIVVSIDTDGKVRTSKLKVLREVPKEEWYA